MKHNILRIDSYKNTYGHEVIEYTCLNKRQYIVEKQYGNIRAYVKINSKWQEMSSKEAAIEYNHVLKVIQYEVQRENNYEKEKTSKKMPQNLVA